MDPVALLGWIAAAVAALLSLPQALRLARTRSVAGLSLPMWQTFVGLSLAWLAHGVRIGQAVQVVPNVLAAGISATVVVLMATRTGRPVWSALLPGLLLAALVVGVDVVFGGVVFGIAVVAPAIAANAGQSLELVRAPDVGGVAPLYLAGALLNQALWSVWGLLVGDPGTLIASTLTGVVCLFNLGWWVARRAGLGPRFVAASTAAGA